MLIFNSILVGAFVVQRLIELAISKSHRSALGAEGVPSVPDPVFPWMVFAHVGLLAGCLLEPWLLDRSFLPALGWPVLGVLLVVQWGRCWVLRALGRHWNTRIMASSETGVVATGPYRFVRHPNYTIVVAETLLLPLFHGAWWTLALVQLVHIPVMVLRIRSEERYLMSVAAYRKSMATKPRFLPRLQRGGVSSGGAETG